MQTIAKERLQPMLKLESLEGTRSGEMQKRYEDIRTAFDALHLPAGYGFDMESNVYNIRGRQVGIITPGRSMGNSPEPVFYDGRHMDDKTRWHLRICLICPLRETACCKRTT